MGALSWRRAISRFALVSGEVIRILISAGPLLAYLHEHVVEKRRRPESVAIRREPRQPERLVDLHEELHGLLRLADAAGRLHTDDATGLLVHVADRLEHAELHRQGRVRRRLAGRRLDEVRASRDREERRPTDVVIRPELARLEDHLEVRATGADLLHADDLVVHLRVPTREERSTVDDHVDLGHSGLDDLTHLGELDLDRRLAGRT